MFGKITGAVRTVLHMIRKQGRTYVSARYVCPANHLFYWQTRRSAPTVPEPHVITAFTRNTLT